MALIYFYGPPPLSLYNPDNSFREFSTVIRGYDAAGNSLVHIREPTQSIPRALLFPGSSNPDPYPICPYPISLDGDRQGHIYSAWNFEFGNFKALNGYDNQFRVYRRNGDRIPWPHPCGAFFAFCVAVDKDERRVYIGAYIGDPSTYLPTAPPTGIENRQILFRYQPDGTVVWSMAFSPGFFTVPNPNFPGQTITAPTYDVVRKIIVSPTGDLFVIGYFFPYEQFLVKVSSGGVPQWSFAVNSAIHDVCWDDSGKIYMVFEGAHSYCADYFSKKDEAIFLPEFIRFNPGAGVNVRYQICRLSAAGTLEAFAQSPEVPPGDNGDFNTYYLHRAVWFSGNLIVARRDNPDGLLFYFNSNLELVSTLPISPDINSDRTVPDYYRKTYYGQASFAIDPETGFMYFPGRRVTKPLVDSEGDLHLFIIGSTQQTVWGAYHFLSITQSGVWRWQNKNATGAPGVDSLGQDWSVYSQLSTNGLTLAQVHAEVDNVPDFAGFSVSLGVRDDFWNLTNGSQGRPLDHQAALVSDTETPALMIPIAVKPPGTLGDRFSRAPGIPFSILLAVPRPTREYLGAAVRVFRLFVTGASPAMELALKFVQVRRNTFTEQLTIVTPIVAPELLIDLEARRAAGGELVLYYGVRLPGVGEQLDELLRVPLLAARFDRGPQSGSITLSGDHATSIGGQARPARAISYRGTNSGRRRVRCAMDPWLLPGDTLLLGGGESLLVREITLYGATHSGHMEVSE